MAFIPPPRRMPELDSAVRGGGARAYSLMACKLKQTQYRNSDCVYSDVWMVTDGSTGLLLARNLKAITAATTQGIA